MLVETAIAIPIAPNSVTKKNEETVKKNKDTKRLKAWY
jgi:hypothetical protein